MSLFVCFVLSGWFLVLVWLSFLNGTELLFFVKSLFSQLCSADMAEMSHVSEETLVMFFFLFSLEEPLFFKQILPTV